MYICDNCGKGIMRGNAVSHAKNRTKRVFLPNLHTVKALINGQPKIIRVCTKCLRRVTKAPKRDFQKTQNTQRAGKSEEPEKSEIQKEEVKRRRGRPKRGDIMPPAVAPSPLNKNE